MTNMTVPGPQRLPGSNGDNRRAQANRMHFLAAALFLLSMVIFLPPYRDAFVGDDYLHLGYIAEFLPQPTAALRVLDPLWTHWYYRPLQNLWFLFCRLLFGLNPFAFYFLQTLWHVVAASALLALAKKLRLPAGAAVMALALFVVHGQHHDVVAWISSIAVIMVTTFSLLSTLAYAHYLEEPARKRWLFLVALFTLLALLSHEEGILLPVFLLGARLVVWRSRGMKRRERAFFVALAMGSLAFGLTHFLRPNNTLSLQSQNLAGWFSALHPYHLAEFLLAVPSRWLLLNKSTAGLTLYAFIARQPILTLLAAGAILVLLVYAFWRGDRMVRLSLLWAIPHLAFLYLTLWLQKPELFAGRHLYSSWAFVALALADRGSRWYKQHSARQRHRALLTVLALFYALNTAVIGDDQRAWEAHTSHVTSVEEQMKALIPAVTADTAIYAHRFVLLPSFTPYAAAVWYGEPGISGGSLDKLRVQGWLDDQSYLLDYDGERLHNLLPDLQVYGRSRILWKTPGASLIGSGSGDGPTATYSLLQVAGPEDARRLAIRVRQPTQGWLALVYDLESNSGEFLSTDVLGPPGTVFRVRLLVDDEHMVLVKTVATTAETVMSWQPLLIPLSVDGHLARAVLLDTRGPAEEAYWTMPRVVMP